MLHKLKLRIFQDHSIMGPSESASEPVSRQGSYIGSFLNLKIRNEGYILLDGIFLSIFDLKNGEKTRRKI